MTTEQTIREAYERYSGGYAPEEHEVSYQDFKAGYLALLNSLEKCGSELRGRDFYFLPEGVTK